MVFAATDLELLQSQEVIDRGRYLSLAGNCTACHTTAGGGFMSGGVAFRTPFGIVYSTNITPDKETGIGGWTAEEFADSMRAGIRPGGEHKKARWNHFVGKEGRKNHYPEWKGNRRYLPGQF